MSSHKAMFGHRMSGEIVDTFNSSYGGDFAIPVQLQTVKCKVCGRAECRRVKI